MSELRAPVVALRRSHDRLATLADQLGEAGASTQSYCTNWSAAQVLSHLGSGAEMVQRSLDEALGRGEPLAQDERQAIWDRWNAKSPVQQIRDSLEVDEAVVAAFEVLDDDELAAAHITMFGMFELDGSGLARFRLQEHAMHTWDVEVALDPTAQVATDAAELVLDHNLAAFMGFLGKPQGKTWSLAVHTTDPERELVLRVADEATLSPAAGETETDDGELTLPAEALWRLTYGRLDAGHADGVDLKSSTVSLDDLRATFPGL